MSEDSDVDYPESGVDAEDIHEEESPEEGMEDEAREAEEALAAARLYERRRHRAQIWK
ncbi:hypothetical protein Tsp_05867 [Trichinella spiralis]|uniref:hypothetical protein n=1 Tax=Trichinella spiralis TaxID=6334 RepID=UPI0001EFC5BD|nr:conserved hypothetical protein [Trichinella spiralis]XP_003380153.1 hypothetical protein Tsp_05867 [Trichinella spiralis]